MKKLLMGLILMMLCGIGVSVNGAVPRSIVGASGECDTTIDGCIEFPASLSLLCDGGGIILDCPQYFHPDWSSDGTRLYGITNRVNPPRYIVSTDGGSVWGLVTTQPFTAAVLNLGSYMAVASDGSLLAGSGQGINTCIIRRSTDQGTSWSTVFTDTTRQCSRGFGSPSPPGMYCAESGGYCAIIDMFSGVTITVIFSTDNGANWTVGTTYAHVSTDSRTWGPIINSVENTGILIRGTNGSSGQPFGARSGNDFVATLSLVTAVNLNCRPLYMGNSPHAICAPSAGGNTYRFTTGGALGIAPVEINTFTVADTSGALEPQVVGFNSTTGYMIQVSIATPTRLNMFITRDTWTTVVLAGQITPTTSPIAGCCKGNIMVWNGKIYFSSGATSTNAFLAVIQ